MNVITTGIKFIVIDIIGDFVYWPIWWYTIGLKDCFVFCAVQIKKTWLSLGLNIWLKNLFTPMYGDRSFVGRLISLIVRIVVLFWRLLWFFFWTSFVLAMLFIWIIGPIIVVYMILRHFSFK